MTLNKIYSTVRMLLSVLLAVCAASLVPIWLFVLSCLTPLLGSQRVHVLKSSLVGVFLRFVRFLTSDVKVILSGDIDELKRTSKNKSVHLHNHQTELDWLFSTFLYSILGKEGDFSAMMKSSLRSIPFFEYAINDLHMCFLDRNWEQDQSHFDSFLTNYLSALNPISFLLSPEGTVICRSTYEKSQRYATNMGRPVLEHVLLPRSMGLSYVLKRLHEAHLQTGEDFYVYDTTMQFEGYSGEICGEHYEREIDTTFPSLMNVFGKRIPLTLHMHVSVVNVEDIVKGSDDLEAINCKVQQWLDASYVEKDKQMEYFIKNKQWSPEWLANRKVFTFDRKQKILDSPKWIFMISIGLGFVWFIVFLLKFVLINIKNVLV